MRRNVVERVRINPKLLAPCCPAIRSAPFVLSLGVAFKPELVDIVTKVVVVAVFEVGNKVLDVASVENKRATGGEVEVSGDLVDANTSSNRAAFRILLVNFCSPVLSSTLSIKCVS